MSNDTLEAVKKKHPDDCQWCGKTRQLVKEFLVCSLCDRPPTFLGANK